MKKIKFTSYENACQLMAHLIRLNIAETWTMTSSGYVRYLCTVSRRWVNVTDGAIKAWSMQYSISA